MNRSLLKEVWESKNIKFENKLNLISLYIKPLDNNKDLNFNFNYMLFTQMLHFLCHESTLIIKRWDDETCQYIKYEITDEILNEKDSNIQLKNLNKIRTHLYMNQSNNNIKRLLSKIMKNIINPFETYLKSIEIFNYGLAKMDLTDLNLDVAIFQNMFHHIAANISKFNKRVYDRFNDSVITLYPTQIGE